MEANNHFNYGPHSVSTNSGLKHSSGDSLYTNGSTMSFPPQGKSLNGDMNVNGITTADGASQSGPHPPPSSYSHMSNHHHQGNMGYDYLWNQYNPAMGSGAASSTGHGMHQKTGSQAVMSQQQPQDHFQGHGQYQVNGSIAGSRQPPVGGAQYWGRGNPGHQQGGTSMSMGYNSHGMYGGYPNQVHTGIPQTSHHQQPPPMQHQPATALHHHPQHHPPQHLQPQQQQHYGMVPNGMPYYQHQPQNAPVSSQQSQSQSQPQTPLMPTTQSFTSPRGSPQHHHMGRGGTSSPLPVQVPMMSPSAISDNGSPQRRESPGRSNVAHSSGIQGHMNESYKEVDQGYNGVERSSVPQRLSTSEGFPVKPPGTSIGPTNDYSPQLQQPVVDVEPGNQCHDMRATFKELSPTTVSGPSPQMATPPCQMSVALPQTLSGPSPVLQSSYSTVVSESPTGGSAHAPVIPKTEVNTQSAMGSPPQLLTTPPLIVQGLRPAVVSVSQSSVAVHATLSNSPSVSTTPQMGQSSKASPPAVSAQPLVSKSLESPSKTPAPPQIALAHLVESHGSKVPQVPQLSISQDTLVPVSSNSSSTTAHPQRDTPVVPSPTSPAATTDSFPLHVVSKCLDFTSTVSTSVSSKLVSSPHHSSAPPPTVSADPHASTSSPSAFTAPNVSVSSAETVAVLPRGVTKFVPCPPQSPGHVASHKADQHAFDGPCSPQKTSSEPEVRHIHHKASVPNSMSNQECHTDSISQDFMKISETSLSIPCSERPERDIMPAFEKDTDINRDQSISGMENSNTLNDTLGTETSLNYPSLAESTYSDGSKVENIGSLLDSSNVSLDNASQAEDPAMFQDESVAKDSRDRFLVDIQSENTSLEEETFNSGLTTRSSIEETPFEDTSQLDSSLNPTSQNYGSLMLSSINDFSVQSPKVNDLKGSEEGHGAPDTKGQEAAGVPDITVGFSTPLPVVPCTLGTKKPRKPRTPKALNPPVQGAPDVKKKRKTSTPKVPKEEKGKRKKKTEEKPPSATRKRKTSKQITEVPVVSTSPLLPAGAPCPENVTGDPSLTNSETSISKSEKVKKPKVKEIAAKSPKPPKTEAVVDADTKEDNDDSSSTAETPKRRIATEEQVNFPILHGWKREIRVRRLEDRLKGETWYYSPCGRRMKQFPEVIKYLRRHQDNLNGVTREHFSFSPRMPVGDFYEERDAPEGKKWFLLANEEVPSIIMAITGRRGRPPNPDKESKPRARARRPKGAPARRPGRPPKPKMVELLSKIDARLLKRLEAKEELTEEDKEKLLKIKKKMKKKARMKRKQDVKNKKIRQEKLKVKLEHAKEPIQAAQMQSQASETDASKPGPEQPKKPGRRKKASVEEDLEKASPMKRVAGARSKAKALAKAQAEAEAQAQAALAAKRQAERKAQAQRRMEERKRQQMILEELKKPTEDMCLTDHTPLPELSRIPGQVLSGVAFSHLVTVVEFLHGYGKVLGLQVPKDIPSLATLQEGLLGLGNSQGELLDLLIKLVEAALHDPGLPSYYQSVKILGEKLVDLELSHSTVSEVLRIFLESHGFEREVCDSLRTKSFQTLCPNIKASILGFLVEELNASNIVIREIDNTLENMTTYRKNKWIIEGKLRKLKAALARKTGRSEEELCFEERRRSARVGVAEEESMEDSGLLDRSSRRRPKEEPKHVESESPNGASIPELERQIDKLTKRQVFFRKKLLQSSHCMRAMSLGQDRYRRRYWLMPHMGAVLVEGAEEILASGDILVKDEPMTPIKKEPVSPVKAEVKVEPPLSPKPSNTKPPVPCPPPTNPSSVEVDPLPGEASLMSSPRGRGRPRKIKPEVELHLRTVKNRRRRRSSKSGGEDAVVTTGPDGAMQDLTQSTFQAWLSQSQGSGSGGPTDLASKSGTGEDGGQQEDGMKELAEKRGQWFNLLPKEPCEEGSLSQPHPPSASSAPPAEDAPVPGPSPPPQVVIPPQVCSTPLPRPARRRRRGSGAGRSHRAGAVKRRGRPPSSLFQEMEQKYFTQLVAKPIPLEMVKGWWWVKEPEELTAILSALHPRGVREKVLHKHLTKHMEFLVEFCTRPMTDPIFQLKVEEAKMLQEMVQQPWVEQPRAMQIDLIVLQWVEDLEHRVVGADLQLKLAPPNGPSGTENATESSTAGFQVFTVPEPDSTRDDLQYYEHEVDPRDDWIVKTKREWVDLLRVTSNPVDLAVLRLTNLERNIERRYLKEPLWNLAEVVRLAPLTPPPGGEDIPLDVVSLESEITPRLRIWRQGLNRCRSASQVSLCLLQLERAIAWEKSIVKVTCQVCRKGDNDEYLLLCDGCDRGWHMFCLRPKVIQVPEGDWFCPNCISMGMGETPRPQRSARQRSKVRKRRFTYGPESSDEEDGHRRSIITRQKDVHNPSSRTSSSPSKRRRMATRNQPDLTYCEIILMEMEAHSDAWPFLEPVNPRLVPGYRRIIKNPMDFLTMRERLLQGGYCSCDEFAADAQLVFNNCELFNEDSSEVGMAGHSMRRFFESRWAEFYSTSDK
ncbi:bromodomain adjacent to zinc finger domain protein 2A isoform X2 [Brachyhypopomus gauderio]|uniref:bromodomain adjacent to zinc finger domain protein 2A isoform X2 n=1 Tax=Brachyhypopomus gauderio TaxID=698409 RepID=UPI004041D13B